MMTDSNWRPEYPLDRTQWDLAACPDHRVPALCRAGLLQTSQRGTDPAQRWLRDTQEHNGLLMAGRTLCCLRLLDSFLSPLRSGARGEVWLHASDDSCWHTPLY